VINLLDDTLTKLLEAAPAGGALDELHNAYVSFETPEHGHKPQGKSEVNLFLYETKENRELREPSPITRQQNGVSARRRAPLRVDCAYMVTTWGDGKTKSEIVTASHKLLAQAFNWLSRFPAIPELYLQAAGMTGQVFAPPTMVAQMDGAKSAGEFWHALGIPPRPYFNLVVTITMDLDQQIEDSIVTTISSNYHATQPATGDEHLLIGGTVRDPAGNPVPDTWVLLEQLNLTQITDASGQFIFEKVVRRGGLTLRARASGFREVQRPIEIPSVTGEYDLQLI
jgi:hypothetical protein